MSNIYDKEMLANYNRKSALFSTHCLFVYVLNVVLLVYFSSFEKKAYKS